MKSKSHRSANRLFMANEIIQKMKTARQTTMKHISSTFVSIFFFFSIVFYLFSLSFCVICGFSSERNKKYFLMKFSNKTNIWNVTKSTGDSKISKEEKNVWITRKVIEKMRLECEWPKPRQWTWRAQRFLVLRRFIFSFCCLALLFSFVYQFENHKYFAFN